MSITSFQDVIIAVKSRLHQPTLIDLDAIERIAGHGFLTDFRYTLGVGPNSLTITGPGAIMSGADLDAHDHPDDAPSSGIYTWTLMQGDAELLNGSHHWQCEDDFSPQAIASTILGEVLS